MGMNIEIKKQLEIYITANGKKPFIEWLEALDAKIRYRIKEKLDRLSLGNFGDHKYICDGIYELRLDFGAGYRIYYGLENDKVILLLSGGNKATQKKDIQKAIKYFRDYLSR